MKSTIQECRLSFSCSRLVNQPRALGRRISGLGESTSVVYVVNCCCCLIAAASIYVLCRQSYYPAVTSYVRIQPLSDLWGPVILTRYGLSPHCRSDGTIAQLDQKSSTGNTAPPANKYLPLTVGPSLISSTFWCLRCCGWERYRPSFSSPLSPSPHRLK